jgi:type I restriction enzyme M protein
MPDSSAIVSKVWSYAHVLKNAGGGYGDYIEVRAARALITYLLFLKLAPPSPRLRRAGSEMTELGSKVAVASRLSSWILGQRRDASDTIAENLGKEPCLGAQQPCLCV